MLPTSNWNSPPLTPQDSKWLTHAVNDALAGTDIGGRYPAFFQKLVTNDNLCRAFLDELDQQQPDS